MIFLLYKSFEGVKKENIIMPLRRKGAKSNFAEKLSLAILRVLASLWLKYFFKGSIKSIKFIILFSQ
jgi:hypothetical protein